MFFIENQTIGLEPYTHQDDYDMYLCWKDVDTQNSDSAQIQFCPASLSCARYHSNILPIFLYTDICQIYTLKPVETPLFRILYFYGSGKSKSPGQGMDDYDMYLCWKDVDTQKGYNGIFDQTLDEFRKTDISRFKFSPQPASSVSSGIPVLSNLSA